MLVVRCRWTNECVSDSSGIFYHTVINVVYISKRPVEGLTRWRMKDGGKTPQLGEHRLQLNVHPAETAHTWAVD